MVNIDLNIGSNVQVRCIEMFEFQSTCKVCCTAELICMCTFVCLWHFGLVSLNPHFKMLPDQKNDYDDDYDFHTVCAFSL